MHVLWRALLAASCILAGQLPAIAAPEAVWPYRGANFIQSDQAPLDSVATRDSLLRLKDLGANTVAFVVYFWQKQATDEGVTRGNSINDAQLVGGIRRARSLGLQVVLKSHVWLEDRHWAGEIKMADDAAWRRWFANYQKTLVHYARLAEQEHVDVLAIGTELTKAAQLPYWRGVIAATRKLYHGKLTYVAHGREELQRFAQWQALDVISMTLYEPLADPRHFAPNKAQAASLLAAMKAAADRYHRPIWVAELGVRSASQAEKQPWEATEQRTAITDLRVQAQFIDLWLHILNKPWIQGLLVWCWYSEPGAGGLQDTDFTVQNKPAEDLLRCHWRHAVEI